MGRPDLSRVGENRTRAHLASAEKELGVTHLVHFGQNIELMKNRDGDAQRGLRCDAPAEKESVPDDETMRRRESIRRRVSRGRFQRGDGNHLLANFW